MLDKFLPVKGGKEYEQRMDNGDHRGRLDHCKSCDNRDSDVFLPRSGFENTTVLDTYKDEYEWRCRMSAEGCVATVTRATVSHRLWMDVGSIRESDSVRGIVHHIGSTAIPRILAKHVIDILVVVANINFVDIQSAELETLGYETMGEFGIPARRYFRKDDDADMRTHHVHAFEQGNNQIERHLAFRDFMSAHPDWAAQYSELKRKLVAMYPASMESYIEGKNDFIKHMDRLATAWRRNTIR